ncbi:MAG: hypothetical protein ACXACG_02100 [Candidatus Thorarchaeota archaeon]
MYHEIRSNQDFMRLVEKGESRVYLEDSTTRQLLLRFFLPIILGPCASIATIVIATAAGFPWDVLSFFTILLLPSGAGFIIAFISVVKLVGKSREFSVRGISRTDLSISIAFLDMIKEGEVDVGRIINPNSPEEYSHLKTQVLRVVIRVLNKIDPGMGSKWIELLSQRLSQEFSFREKLFLRIVVFGTTIAVVMGFVLEILMRVGFIEGLLAFYLLAGDVVIGLVLGIALIVYTIRHRNEEPPKEVELAIRDPEVRNETEYVLTRVFKIFFEESKHPLRVLVLGSYEDMEYTDRVFTTSREKTLREAVLLTKQEKQM